MAPWFRRAGHNRPKSADTTHDVNSIGSHQSKAPFLRGHPWARGRVPLCGRPSGPRTRPAFAARAQSPQRASPPCPGPPPRPPARAATPCDLRRGQPQQAARRPAPQVGWTNLQGASSKFAGSALIARFYQVISAARCEFSSGCSPLQGVTGR